MRTLILATPIIAALAVTACGPRVQYLQTSERVTYTTYPVTYVAPRPTAQTDLYPGSALDSRGYRVDSGSYAAATGAGEGPMSPAQMQARAQRERQGNRNAIAWSHNGYHYDYWGNLVRADR
jgi:hypothetical protein